MTHFDRAQFCPAAQHPSGKTTLAGALHDRQPDWLTFDSEYVGLRGRRGVARFLDVAQEELARRNDARVPDNAERGAQARAF